MAYKYDENQKKWFDNYGNDVTGFLAIKNSGAKDIGEEIGKEIDEHNQKIEEQETEKNKENIRNEAIKFVKQNNLL